MPLDLEINDQYSRKTPTDFVERVVAAVLEYVDRADMSVSMLLSDEAEIASIHERFLGDASATDVIAFPLDDGVDLAISVERAENEAARLGHSVEAELALYIVHGILHVSGYDDIEAAERAGMRDAEREVLAKLALRVAEVDR